MTDTPTTAQPVDMVELEQCSTWPAEDQLDLVYRDIKEALQTALVVHLNPDTIMVLPKGVPGGTYRLVPTKEPRSGSEARAFMLRRIFNPELKADDV